MNNQQEKNYYKQKESFSLPQAFFVAVAVAFACAILFTQVFKVYRSEMTLMVVARSEKSAAQKKDIVENLSGLPQSLSFYDLLLEENPDLADRNAYESAEKRRSDWRKILDVSQPKIKNNPYIIIGITTSDRSGSEKIAQKTAQTLISMTGRYYDIRKDIDVRIIDGPVTIQETINRPLIAILSFAAGLAAFGLIVMFPKMKLRESGSRIKTSSFVALNGIKDIFSKKEAVATEEGKKEIESIYSAEEGLKVESQQKVVSSEKEIVPEVKEETTTYSKAPDNLPIAQETSAMYPNFPEFPVSHPKMGGAPSNLPFADENFVFMTAPENVIDTEPKEEPKEEIKKHEPTPEELKSRLNKLLQGEL